MVVVVVLVVVLVVVVVVVVVVVLVVVVMVVVVVGDGGRGRGSGGDGGGSSRAVSCLHPKICDDAGHVGLPIPDNVTSVGCSQPIIGFEYSTFNVCPTLVITTLPLLHAHSLCMMLHYAFCRSVRPSVCSALCTVHA